MAYWKQEEQNKKVRNLPSELLEISGLYNEETALGELSTNMACWTKEKKWKTMKDLPGEF